jgi:hypothetical protein
VTVRGGDGVREREGEREREREKEGETERFLTKTCICKIFKSINQFQVLKFVLVLVNAYYT